MIAFYQKFGKTAVIIPRYPLQPLSSKEIKSFRLAAIRQCIRDNLTLEETANELGVSLAALRSLVRRAGISARGFRKEEQADES